jgi:hypothetical protein
MVWEWLPRNDRGMSTEVDNTCALLDNYYLLCRVAPVLLADKHDDGNELERKDDSLDNSLEEHRNHSISYG